MKKILLVIITIFIGCSFAYCKDARVNILLHLNLDDISSSTSHQPYYNVTTVDGKIIVENTTIDKYRIDVTIPLFKESIILYSQGSVKRPDALMYKINIFDLKRSGVSTVKSIYIKLNDLYFSCYGGMVTPSYGHYALTMSKADIEFFSDQEIGINFSKLPDQKKYDRDHEGPDSEIFNIEFNLFVKYVDDNMISVRSEINKYKKSLQQRELIGYKI